MKKKKSEIRKLLRQLKETNPAISPEPDEMRASAIQLKNEFTQTPSQPSTNRDQDCKYASFCKMNCLGCRRLA